nr:cysteine--tRNA ligase [Treponemataceae bacterium]
PVHHTNEIAQSEGATGRKWVNYWLHNEFLVVQKKKDGSDGSGGAESGKMSKSAGNFLTLQSLIDEGYDALDYRFFLLGAHYRSQVMFSWTAMDSAKNARRALNQRAARLISAAKKSACPDGELSEQAERHLAQFRQALENDLSSPQALSHLQAAVKDGALRPEEALALLRKMDGVLGLDIEREAEQWSAAPSAELLSDSHDGDPEADEINALVAERTAAKKAKDFARADEIRSSLAARGITITDTPHGPVWKRN